MSNLRTLQEKALRFKAPEFVTDDLIYLTIGGSLTYGVSSPDSDIDMYGVCVPPKEKVFPTFGGNIPGFGKPVNAWPHWGYKGAGLDIMVYSVVKFFNMAMLGSPNIIELLFTEDHHISFMTELGVSLRESRDLFLTNNVIPRFTGFYHSQKGKLYYQDGHSGKSGRIEKYGYDTKAAYHSMRLLVELEQLLETGTMNLGMYSNLLTGIRHGGFSAEDIGPMLEAKAEQVKNKKEHSVLREEPNEEYIKQVLTDLLETHWQETLDFL
jgi:predicted nucleotidyltransferase